MSLNSSSYYLAARLEGELLEKALMLQEYLATRYNLYQKPYPPLHVTVGVIFPQSKNGLSKAAELLKSTVKNYLPFDIRAISINCFDSPYKSVNLLIEENHTLRSLSAEIYKVLQENNIEARPFDNWDYHISLANTFYAVREWTYQEFREAVSLLRTEEIYQKCNVSKIELWDPIFPPLKVLATYCSP